jgi:hypothetical protein
LEKQLKSKLYALQNAEKRSGVRQEEIDNLTEVIEILGYLILKLKGDSNG